MNRQCRCVLPSGKAPEGIQLSSAEFELLEPVLVADEIQGNILGGFNKDHQAVLPMRFAANPTSLTAVRSWLKAFLPAITWTSEVVAFKRHRARRMAIEGTEPSDMKVVWRNIAFSFGGLRKLTAQADSFEPLFREGLASASARLGDPTDSATPGSSASWVVGKPGEEPDLLVVIAGDDDSEINAEIDSFLKEAEKAGIGCPFFDIGHDLAYYNDGKTIRFPSGREHFGFEDGISQPGVRGRLSEAVDDFLTPRVLLEVNHDSSLPQFSAPGQPLICPGEFVLGYPRQHESLGRRPATPWPLGPKPFAPAANVVGPYWAKNGSFLVYRRLRQDVPAFNRFLKLEASRLASIPEFKKFTDEQLGAMLVGRWRSGAPMLRTPTDDAPDLGNTTGANNAFGFAANTDPDDGFHGSGRSAWPNLSAG